MDQLCKPVYAAFFAAVLLGAMGNPSATDDVGASPSRRAFSFSVAVVDEPTTTAGAQQADSVQGWATEAPASQPSVPGESESAGASGFTLVTPASQQAQSHVDEPKATTSTLKSSVSHLAASVGETTGAPTFVPDADGSQQAQSSAAEPKGNVRFKLDGHGLHRAQPSVEETTLAPFTLGAAGSQQLQSPVQETTQTPLKMDAAGLQDVQFPAVSTSKPAPPTTKAPQGFMDAILNPLQNAVGQAEDAVAPAAQQIQEKAGQAEQFMAPAAKQLEQKAQQAEKMVAPPAKQIQDKAQEALRLAQKAQGGSVTTTRPSRSDSTNKLRFQQRYTAREMKFSLSTYDKTLVLGFAAVIGVSVAAFVARSAVLRHRAHQALEGCESGLE